MQSFNYTMVLLYSASVLTIIALWQWLLFQQKCSGGNIIVEPYRTHAAAGPVEVPGSLDPVTTTIFISVASYRDTQCRQTLRSIFANADHPARVVIGTCEQNADDEESCVVSAVRLGQVRQISIPASEARGPCYARYLCASLHRGEDIILQVDSHSLFVSHWDTLLLEMLNRVPLGLDAFVLTHYPSDCPAAESASSLGDGATSETIALGPVPVINSCVMLANGQASFRAVFFPSRQGFHSSISVGGGFLCMHRSVLYNCPYDPHLDGVFNMEEILYAARLFTRGVALLAPDHSIMCHKYTYAEHKVPWTEAVPTWNVNANKGLERCFGILHGTVVDRVFGLGQSRHIAEFWKYTGINLKAGTATPFTSTIIAAKNVLHDKYRCLGLGGPLSKRVA